MTEQMSPGYTLEIEKKLDAIYGSAEPDANFASRLEMQLAEKSRTVEKQDLDSPSTTKRFFQSIFARPALAVVVGAALLLFALIAFAGPKEVLAQVQRLLGYSPMSGFIQLGETRILPAPVEQRQGSYVLTVESVVADSQMTRVILTVSGFPHEKFSTGNALQDKYPYLLLPNGVQLRQSQAFSSLGDVLQATLTFPGLPSDVDHFSLVMPRLPSIPAGIAPENWSIPLKLETAGNNQLTATPGVAVAQSYSPPGAAATANGVAISLLNVGQSPEETGLQVQFSWNNPAWTSFLKAQTYLKDNNGLVYGSHQTNMGNGFEFGSRGANSKSAVQTYRFDPFDPQAQSGILTVNILNFSFTSNAHFNFNPGSSPQTGQTWDLSQSTGSPILVAGLPVQLLSASIQEIQDNQLNAAGKHYQLNVLVEAPPQNGVNIASLYLSDSADHPTSGSCEILPNHRFSLSIDLPNMPDHSMNLYLSGGIVDVSGDWVIEWPLPNTPGSN